MHTYRISSAAVFSVTPRANTHGNATHTHTHGTVAVCEIYTVFYAPLLSLSLSPFFFVSSAFTFVIAEFPSADSPSTYRSRFPRFFIYASSILQAPQVRRKKEIIIKHFDVEKYRDQIFKFKLTFFQRRIKRKLA